MGAASATLSSAAGSLTSGSSASPSSAAGSGGAAGGAGAAATAITPFQAIAAAVAAATVLAGGGIAALAPGKDKGASVLNGGKRTLVDNYQGKRLNSPNDSAFKSNGDLYFTDQGQTGLHDATGRVYRYSAGGRLELLVDTLPGPNGLVLSPDEKTLYVGSRSNTIWWQPLRDTHPPFRAGIFATMPGFGTPDGMAIDVDGNVVCVQTNMGVIWVFNKIGLPIYRIETCASDKLTNIAYGGPENKTLFILDGHGKILTAQTQVAGLQMYSHT